MPKPFRVYEVSLDNRSREVGRFRTREEAYAEVRLLNSLHSPLELKYLRFVIDEIPERSRQ